MTTAMHTEVPQPATGNEARKPRLLRRHRLGAAAAALVVGGGALLGIGAGAASASMSSFVNVTYKNFGGAATDCTAYAGAFFRSDKMVQGDAHVPCNYRHTQTVVYVRVIRYDGQYRYGSWKQYVYNNSYGTGGADLVTAPVRVCGPAWWETEVNATVVTGSTSFTVDFTNNWQQYDPCA